jgi:polyketide biosynthesis 3-hydroxy-3-methylglutaryl-CoA synthase-like enzyme PksG
MIGFRLNFYLHGIMYRPSPGAKALVVATDISRFLAVDGGDSLSQDWSFAEPSSGAGAVAMLVSETPYMFQIDQGANGFYGYEVMDTCRPVVDSEAGNADLSLLSYLDCCENTFIEYQNRVEGVDYVTSFQYLSFHTPFGGMIKGAHRNMMRRFAKASPDQIESDFTYRVVPGITYCQRVGNIMGATAALSLLSTIENGSFDTPKRIGCFSYGSGCCSEFYSGVATQEGQTRLGKMGVKAHLNQRYGLSINDYETLMKESHLVKFGTRNVVLDTHLISGVRTSRKTPTLFLKEIKEYHRNYEWVS